MVEIANKQMDARRQELLASTSGLDGLIDLQYKKGEYAGIGLFIAMPEYALSSFDEDIEGLEKQLQENGE